MPRGPSSSPSECLCGRGRPYMACCGRYHQGPEHLLAPDAESLMRSRYTAFALGLDQYLMDTWHPDTRPTAIEPQPKGTHWIGLTVKRAEPTAPERAIVEFVARCKLGGRASRLHETSRFVREGGKWLYVDDDAD